MPICAHQIAVALAASLLTCTTSVLSSTVPLFAQDNKTTGYPLPENGNEVIFAYDLKNGFTPPRQNSAPALLIRANGNIEMPSLYGEGRDIKGKLDAHELQAFLTFVIDENKFLEFDASTVQGQIEEIREKRQVPQIADAPDTIIELTLPGHSHRVRQPAVGMPSEFMQVASLQQLLAIRKGVNRLMSETRVGGKEGIKRLLGTINQKLSGAYPDVAPLKASDFSGSYLKQDGSISASFSRPGQGTDGKPNGTWVTGIAVIVPGGDNPKINLRVKLK
ncbi:MAG TPA: hypothetical protein DEF45_09135 [Rhodopirellula sp.]|nr:hypothetical protein [Rhodopirellula sp.]